MLDFVLSYITVQDLMWLIVAAPLAGFAANGLVSLVVSQYRISEPRFVVILIADLAALLSFILVLMLWYIIYGFSGGTPSVITGPLLRWNGFLNQPLEFGLKADQLAIISAFAIAFVGVAVHIYSAGFVARRKNIAGYFALLNLLLALLLLLVLTDSFFLFFAAWQIASVVGLVFISRNFSDMENIRSGAACYVIELVSGAAFLLVMFLVWKAYADQAMVGFDIFQFSSIHAGAELLLPYAGVISSALLVSVVARSLQFPLYVWLPSAGSAPLPVFTFMYAVGFVLASVYILIRLNFLLVLSPDVLNAASILGGVACLFGAMAAVVQKETKKILSYIVISQAGLAFIGIGVGAFGTALFHIFTYAFYIAALFLGAGSVEVICGGDTVFQMRGLRKYLPVTFWCTLSGAFAASGIYPLSGFFGKSGILWEAYQRGHPALFLCSFLSGIIVAIAIFRMVALMFFGRAPKLQEGERRPEESSASMLAVMVVVAFASVVAGWFGVSEAFGGEDHFRRWLEPGLATQVVGIIGQGRFSELVIAVVFTLFTAHAGLITWIIYAHKRAWAASLVDRFPRIYKLLAEGFYLNYIYERIFVRPLGFASGTLLSKGLEGLIVDGVIVGSVGGAIDFSSRAVSKIRTSLLPGYIFWLVVVLIILIGGCLF